MKFDLVLMGCNDLFRSVLSEEYYWASVTDLDDIHSFPPPPLPLLQRPSIFVRSSQQTDDFNEIQESSFTKLIYLSIYLLPFGTHS